MLRVGLTGAFAAGKSTVAEMFARGGAQVLRADELAHELMRPGQPVFEQVVERFGRDILKPDGSIDRKRLADKAFAGRIAELNQIVHPAVIKAQEQWMREVLARDPHALAIIEAALILEAGVKSSFDKIVVVTCAPEQRLARFMARSGMTAAAAQAELDRRMGAQLPEAEKVKAADFVIDNSGELAQTELQVSKIMNELQSLAAAS